MPGITKAKIFQVPNSTGGTDPVLAYAGMYHPTLTTAPYPNQVQTLNLVTGDHNLYKAPGSTSYSEIWGFEYLPFCGTSGTYVFSYIDVSGTATGGLGYAAPVSGGGTRTITPISSTLSYLSTDLELDKNRDLLMVANPILTNSSLSWPVDGQLAYIPYSDLTSVSLLTSHTPTIIPTATGCSLGYYSVFNLMYQNNGDAAGYYLGSYLRKNVETSMPAIYVVSGVETWTPSSNPVQAVLGVPVYTITANNIVILGGGHLEINGMTVLMNENTEIDVKAGVAGVTPGGELWLTSSTLTHNTTGNCSGNMWQGVRLFGQPASSQFGLYTGPEPMFVGSSSTISYANIAVSAGGTSPRLMVGIGGGGVVMAQSCAFLNNNTGVYFEQYHNHLFTGAPRSNLSRFSGCSFISTDISTVTGPGCTGVLTGIQGFNVDGIMILGCDFENNISGGTSFPSYGIYGTDMGFSVGPPSTCLGCPSYFKNYYMGIVDYCYGSSITPGISYATFTNNIIGIDLQYCSAPVVTQNTFYVRSISSYPSYSSLPSLYLSGPPAGIGLLLQGSDKYVVYSNTFQPNTILSNTVGVLAWRTGPNENLINNNTFSGLACASLSNYDNYSGQTGLWFKCNANSSNQLDVAARGNTGSTYYLNGIRHEQGVLPFDAYPYGSGPSHIYYSGLPSGNTFSVGSAYNLSSPSTETFSFGYWYSSASGTSPLEIPGVPGVTAAANFDVSVYSVSQADICAIPSLSLVSVGASTSTSTATSCICPLPPFPPQPATTTDPVEAYLDILTDINYYMLDSNGIQHRDSLYYWVGQLHSSSGDLQTAHMLLEDGYVDSAYALYDSIPARDSLHGRDSLEFTTWGSKLFDVQSHVFARTAKINGDISYAYVHELNADSLLSADTSIWNHPVLDSASEDTLIAIFHNSTYWGRIGAESILQAYAPETLNSLLTVMPDTLLFPVADTTGGDSTGRKSHSTGNGTAGDNNSLPNINSLIGVQNSIYPNPVTKALQITYQPGTDNSITIQLDDVTGRKMITQTLQPGGNIVDVHMLPPGLYLYKVYEGSILTMKGKIVKQ